MINEKTIDCVTDEIAKELFLNEEGKNIVRAIFTKHSNIDYTGSELITESKLKQLMRDPRYWKYQDAEIVEKVKQGFRDLYR